MSWTSLMFAWALFLLLYCTLCRNKYTLLSLMSPFNHLVVCNCCILFLLSHLFGFHRFCELLPKGQMCLRGESEHEMRQSNGLDRAAAGPPRPLEEEATNGSSSWRQCEARMPFHLHICAQTEFTPQNPRLPKLLLYLILAPSGRKQPTGTRRYLLD